MFDISNASHEHYEAILEIFESGRTQYFGENKRRCGSIDRFFANYITHRILVRVSATNRTIIGYAEATNYPYIPALPPDCWMDWMKLHFCVDLPLSVTNTCFLNNFIYRKDYNPELVRQVLCEIFFREPKLRFIVIPRCPKYGYKFHQKDIPNYYCMEPLSTIFLPKCYSVKTCHNTPKFYVILRNNLIPVMRYRRALPEDNDDIVDIVDDDRPDVKEQLGDYYIAEELLSDSKSFFIVTEINHITSGFIWLNDDVNIFKLLENYDLEPFGNLLKYNPKEIFKKKQFYINSSQRRPMKELFDTEFVKQVYQEIEIECDSSSSLDDIKSETISEKYSHLHKMEKLVETMKDYEYFIQLRKKKLVVYYNIPDTEQPTTAINAKSNVFVIQLFGLITAHDVRRIFRFLLTSFAAYPDKDYCLLSVCVANTMTAYLFEMLKNFIRVPTRPGCHIDEHLYITHRSTIYGELSLYPVREEDVEDIQKVLSEEIPKTFPSPKHISKFRISTISARLSVGAPTYIASDEDLRPQTQNDIDQIVRILENIFEDPYTKYKCFTIRCGDSTRPIDDNTLVGFVIVKPFTSTRFLHKHYYMAERDELSNLMMAELVTFKLHPLFHSQSDVVFRELARQSEFWHFYTFRPTNIPSLPNDLLMNMQPLEPRRTKKIWFGRFDEPSSTDTSSTKNDPSNLEDNCIDYLNDKYAVFEHNLGPSVFMGYSMNIVILGFTDICKAFLRLMIFSWHNTGQNNTDNCLPHINITVVCAPGVMEAEYEHSFRCQTCKNQENCWVNFQNCDAFIKDVSDRMDVRSWIRFVSGKVSAINTETQLIQMESGCEIYYETLLLMCSTEFGVPEKMFSTKSVAPNYSHINNRFDKLIFYHKLMILKEEFAEDYKKSILVYGCHIKAYEFINFLLKHGIKGNEIHLVMPYNMAQTQMNLVLNNPAADERVEGIIREMLEDLEVNMYERMNLIKCSLHDDEKSIKNVTFLSHNEEHELTLECDLFISFNETHIAALISEILQTANVNIEKDFITVDKKYETSASNVYAIGNFIKHENEHNHQYHFVSPQEAAKKLVHVLESDPFKISAPQEEKKFSEPFYFQAQLPLNHFYVKITSPKRYVANHLDNEYGNPLVTYFEGDFTRVRLNEHGMVEEIVVVTKKRMDFDFLKFFCGRHELLLNNMRSRWYLKDIISLLDFFQEQWVELIMHDQFESLRLLNKHLINATAQEISKKNFDRETKQKLLYYYCQDLGVTSQLEYALLEFIREHRNDFSANIALPEDFPVPNKEQKYY